jgi:hypothetical protein
MRPVWRHTRAQNHYPYPALGQRALRVRKGARFALPPVRRGLSDCRSQPTDRQHYPRAPPAEAIPPGAGFFIARIYRLGFPVGQGVHSNASFPPDPCHGGKMVVAFDQPAENPMETNEAECPICLGRMEVESRDEADWLFCPNGCPTEVEAPVRKPPAVEAEPRPSVLRASVGGSRR